MVLNNEEGQALTEYILLISIVVFGFMLASQFINKSGFANKLSLLVTGQFAAAYRYGHVLGKGLDDGGPQYHPRLDGDNSFRIFFNPATN